MDLLAVEPQPGQAAGPAQGRGRRLAEALTLQAARLEAAGFAVGIVRQTGHPADEIVRFAEASGAELVVVGSRSARGDGHGYSGRVASAVARHCHVPVLIARDARPVRSIVLGYDASPDADAALELVERLPWCRPSLVAVVSVFELGEPLLPGLQPGLDADQASARAADLLESRRAAEGIAAEAAARLRRHGLEATGHALHGRASEQLEVLAAQLDADLVMVGSRGLSGPERFLLGSTSDELVVAARTSVLVVRS